MIDPIKVAMAVEKQGLSVVCATCTKYWKGREKGLPEPQCTAIDGCGSPIGGGTFHEYQGPIPDFKVWCFVCGAAPDKFMFIAGNPMLFGICNTHLEDAKSLVPSNSTNDRLQRRYYLEDGKPVPLAIFADNKFRKQNLTELMTEVENYHARKKGLPNPFPV